jgi:2-haloacid dehalogenase
MRDLMVASAVAAALSDERCTALRAVQAITFDVQGTCVDFYRPLLRLGERINQAKSLSIDWAGMSSGWRALYREVLDAVICGTQPWIPVVEIYRDTLDVLLEDRGLASHFCAAERDELAEIWSRLEPWPDTIEGLRRLRQSYVTSTLSNAGMATMVSIVKRAGLPFDAVLTAELVQAYKPAAAVYQLAVDSLGYRPDQILMVACHKYDLKAAHAFGMRTAFIARQLEFGPGVDTDLAPESWIDVPVSSLTELADVLETVNTPGDGAASP